jgi:hypothetical protein
VESDLRAIPVTSHNVFQSPSEHEHWIVDSGASVHGVNDLSILHNPVLFETPRSLHLATSEASGGIVASGSVCLQCSVSQSAYVLWWLHQVQWVPEDSANMISISAAKRDGCSFVTRENGPYEEREERNGRGAAWRKTGCIHLGMHCL